MLHSASGAASTPSGVISYDGNAVIWSTKGISFGVAIQPTHKYNPRSDTEWIESRPINDIHPGERKDLFYKSDGSWSYLGTYDCIDEGIVDLHSLPLSERVCHFYHFCSKLMTLCFIGNSGDI